MLRGLYLAATGMVTQEIRQDVIGNNLANATTSGFKSETATLQSFPEMLLQRLDKHQATPVGPFSAGVMVDAIHTQFASGPLAATGRMTDLALVDAAGATPAFFTVQAGADLAYTRCGAFKIDADGFLVTAEGYPLQGDYGSVYVGSGHFKVDQSGQVLVNDQVVDRLWLASFDAAALNQLRRQGDNVFIAPPEAAPQPAAAGTQVKQGWVEQANVDVTREIVDMLAVLRAYEANQKAIQAEDQLLGKSVNEVGSLK